MDKTAQKLPELEFRNETIKSLVSRLAGEDVLIVTDPFNYPKVSGAGRCVVAPDNRCEQIPVIKSGPDYCRVIAVGGCAALDIGRACAVGKSITVIPAILSTSCISLDRSVIKYGGINRLEKTWLPEKVIICMPDLMNMPPAELAKWCQSGFGDLFTMAAASIDLQYKKGDLSIDAVIGNVGECFEAVNWVINEFDGYNETSVKALARFLHDSSLVVVIRDDSNLNAAGEHLLYHSLLRLNPQYTSSKPTHGQIVAAGTIIAAAIYREQTGNALILETISKAFKKLGLPLTYDELSKAGIEKRHLEEGLCDIKHLGSHLGDYFKTNDFGILDRIFSAQSPAL
ncbi:MAG TPA: hypothetical protein PK467_01035 [Candidatus Wallbacteria bacterium]|nr:hypothetical protein [Candidatus Wallbacteria bacterium]